MDNKKTMPPKSHYEYHFDIYSGMVKESTDKSVLLYNVLIIAGSTALAVLASLFKNDVSCEARFLFFVITIVLSLSVIISFIILNSIVKGVNRGTLNYRDEIFNAIDEQREVKRVGSYYKKSTIILVNVVPILFILAIILLVLYAYFVSMS